MSGRGRPRDAEADARIVEATRALLQEGGLDAVTIAAVAQRAGVGRPTVYRRYPDRAALATLVLFHDLEQRVGATAVPEGASLVDQLAAMVEPLYRYYAENPVLSAAMIGLGTFGASPVQPQLEAQVWQFLAAVNGRLEAARSRGELPPDADLPLLGYAFFALYFMTAIGGMKGMFPRVEDQLAVFRRMMAQQLAGAGWRAPGNTG
jgi:AcrR family transcriptional regulator